MSTSEKFFRQYIKVAEFEPFASFNPIGAQTVKTLFSTDSDIITSSLVDICMLPNARGVDKGGVEFYFISGYAPYLNISFIDASEAHTFPISSYRWDFGDPFNEGPYDIYDTGSNFYTVDDVNILSGEFNNPCWVTDKQGHAANHTYIMPGTYNVTLTVEASCTGTADKYKGRDSTQPNIKNFYVYVKEIPPQCNKSIKASLSPISGYTNIPGGINNSSQVTAYFMASGIIAGSFPIERIDWDFGDGKIQTISKSFPISATDDDLLLYNLNVYEDIDDPRNIAVPHIFSNNTEDDLFFNICISAYAMNTNSMIECSGGMLVHLTPPTPGDAEERHTSGKRNLLNSRYDDSGNLIYILEDVKNENMLHTIVVTPSSEYIINTETDVITATILDPRNICSGLGESIIINERTVSSTPYKKLYGEWNTVSSVCFNPKKGVYTKQDNCPDGYIGNMSLSAPVTTTYFSKIPFIGDTWVVSDSSTCDLCYSIESLVSTVTTFWNNPSNPCYGGYKESILTYTYNISTPAIESFPALTGDMTFRYYDCYDPVITPTSRNIPCSSYYSGTSGMITETNIITTTRFSNIDFIDHWVAADESQCGIVISDTIETKYVSAIWGGPIEIGCAELDYYESVTRSERYKYTPPKNGMGYSPWVEKETICYPPVVSVTSKQEACPYGYSHNTQTMTLTNHASTTYISHQTFVDDNTWVVSDSSSCLLQYGFLTTATSAVSVYWNGLNKQCSGLYSEEKIIYVCDIYSPVGETGVPDITGDWVLFSCDCFPPSAVTVTSSISCPVGYTGNMTLSNTKYITHFSKEEITPSESWVVSNSASCVLAYNTSTSSYFITAKWDSGDNKCTGYNESKTTVVYNISAPIITSYPTLTSFKSSSFDCFPPSAVTVTSSISCPVGYTGNMTLSNTKYITHFSKEEITPSESWVVSNSASCVFNMNPLVDKMPVAAMFLNNTTHARPAGGGLYWKTPHFKPNGNNVLYSMGGYPLSGAANIGDDFVNIPTSLNPSFNNAYSSRYSVITASGFANGYELLNGLVIEGLYIGNATDYNKISGVGYTIPEGSFASYVAAITSAGYTATNVDGRKYHELRATIPNANSVNFTLYNIVDLGETYALFNKPFFGSTYVYDGQTTGFVNAIWIRISKNGTVLHNNWHVKTSGIGIRPTFTVTVPS